MCLVEPQELRTPPKKRSGERLLGICGAGLLGYLRPFLEFLKNGRHRGNQVGLGGQEKHTRRFHCSKVYIKCKCVIHPMKQHSMYCYLLNFSLMIYIILSQLMHLWLEELLPHFSIVDMSQTSSCLAGNRPHMAIVWVSFHHFLLSNWNWEQHFKLQPKTLQIWCSHSSSFAGVGNNLWIHTWWKLQSPGHRRHWLKAVTANLECTLDVFRLS